MDNDVSNMDGIPKDELHTSAIQQYETLTLTLIISQKWKKKVQRLVSPTGCETWSQCVLLLLGYGVLFICFIEQLFDSTFNY